MQAIVIFKGYINLQWAAIGEALFIFSEVLCLKTSFKIAPFLKNWGLPVHRYHRFLSVSLIYHKNIHFSIRHFTQNYRFLLMRNAEICLLALKTVDCKLVF